MVGALAAALVAAPGVSAQSAESAPSADSSTGEPAPLTFDVLGAVPEPSSTRFTAAADGASAKAGRLPLSRVVSGVNREMGVRKGVRSSAGQ